MDRVLALYRDGWRRYAEFGGRSSVGAFWAFVGVNIAIAAVLGVARSSVEGSAVAEASGVMALVLVQLAFAIAAFTPAIAIGTRRLRDAQLSQLFWLLLLLAPLGMIALIVLWSLPSREPAGQLRDATPQGWFADPFDTSQVRWWDGHEWTWHVAPATPTVEAVSTTTREPERQSEWTAPS